jgi:Lon protease-like protein
MGTMSDDLSALAGFNGLARLFPLPNLVLFPYVIQPLHIFEPRYQQMTADALAADRLITLVLLRPGWEDDYEGRPAVHGVGCLGKIVADQRVDAGRYNLLLRGLRRVRLLDEVSTDRAYRTARVELLEDCGTLSPGDAAVLRAELTERLPQWLPPGAAVMDQFQKLLQSDLSPAALCDVFAFALPLEPALKQELLEELDVAARASRLLAVLREHSPNPEGVVQQARKFPPDFSEN